jgi:hypothetical protein
MGEYHYGGDGFGSRSDHMKEEEIKTCPACLLRTNSYKKHCPRCFTNLDSGEPWADPKVPPEGNEEKYCTRCGSDNIGSNGVHVDNPPAGMGHQWCRECVLDVQNGRPTKIFWPMTKGGCASPELSRLLLSQRLLRLERSGGASIDKVPCKRCGALILPSTAAETDGYCNNPHCGEPLKPKSEAKWWQFWRW